MDGLRWFGGSFSEYNLQTALRLSDLSHALKRLKTHSYSRLTVTYATHTQYTHNGTKPPSCISLIVYSLLMLLHISKVQHLIPIK